VSTQTTLVAAIGTCLVVGATTAAIVLIARRSAIRSAVSSQSAALRELRNLNAHYWQIVADQGPIMHRHTEVVGSKSKFDTFDLDELFLREIEKHEVQVGAEISARRRAWQGYQDYKQRCASVAHTYLGKACPPGVNWSLARKIEDQIFHQEILREPQLVANIEIGVGYRSPQGKNTYWWAKTYSFADLEQAYSYMRERRRHSSLAANQRQAERAKMTSSMRVDVLRRDGYRCRFCGATSKVANLEIDHIEPVSHGGKTTVDNLQVLCSDCNRGKSNRFRG
jgi:5-methylcytosine-specific restriction endonuclease McrA